MKVGLTGGIGCGKSTVARMFQDAGWRTLESDQIVADILSGDAAVHAALRERWGDKIFSDDGQVNRRAIAEKVFQDEEELSWLEQLLHPLVRKFWQESVQADPQSDWLVEIPLMFEKRLETAFDLVVCVASPPDVVETRMVARGYTGEEIERRRQRQMPLDEKIRLADHVITNAGNLEFLENQTKRLIGQIQGA
ncbi:dephospho-CoA kinase [Coraliomargarita sinensis]|uniref:Dephospho-CoA kinase n=1 Tax=Coraliomargarita sinensis TaxID=2174842 RepID=A0A317ZEN2_9BACT|nr:dephospho-CoA kinase [Coraliomargarita sinensis]PXA03232.1 dephospho-CoA kinase [Coraliomargarita sinensis]